MNGTAKNVVFHVHAAHMGEGIHRRSYPFL